MYTTICDDFQFDGRRDMSIVWSVRATFNTEKPKCTVSLGGGGQIQNAFRRIYCVFMLIQWDWNGHARECL